MEDATIGRMFFNRVDKYGPRTLFKVKRDGEYVNISWNETGKAAKECALGLIEAGIERGDRIALLSENRPEWAFSDLGILSIGAVNVPIYATNTPSQVEYILNDSVARILIVSNLKQLEKALEVKSNCPALERIIVLDEIGDTDYPIVSTFARLREEGAGSGKKNRAWCLRFRKWNAR